MKRFSRIVLLCCCLLAPMHECLSNEDHVTRIVRIQSLNEKTLVEVSKEFSWLGYDEAKSMRFANALFGMFFGVGSSPMGLDSDDKKRSLCFAGASPRDVEETYLFARVLSPHHDKNHILNFIIEHEAAHCLGYIRRAGLAINDDYKYVMIEEARADAESYLTIEKSDNANQEDFLRLITTKRFFDALRGDTHHAGIFLMLALIKDRDTSVSHAISKSAQMSYFDYPELNEFYLSLRGAIAVGEDGGEEQACAWNAAMENAPQYLKAITPSLPELRSIGKQIYADSSDWRKDAFALKSGISPKKARFPQCGSPRS